MCATLITWALLFIFEIASFIVGIIISGYSRSHSNIFEQGPGIIAMLMTGWIPSLATSFVAAAIRYIAIKIKANGMLKNRGKENKLYAPTIAPELPKDKK